MPRAAERSARLLFADFARRGNLAHYAYSPTMDTINLLSIEETGHAGRGAFAKQDISAANCVYSIARPVAAALDVSLLPSFCSWCFKSSVELGLTTSPARTNKPCTKCGVLYYCSRSCQEHSWFAHHRYECKLFASFTAQRRTLPNGARLVLQMINVIAKQNNDCFKDLQAHMEDIIKAGGERKDTLDAIALGMFLYTDKRLSLETIRLLFGQMFTNGMTLMDSSLVSLGVCIDPTASMLNHSCDPNAYVVFDGPRLQIRTLRPLSRGEEVTIGYVECTNPLHMRQSRLLEQYYFTCKCRKCLADSIVLEASSEEVSTRLVEERAFKLLDKAMDRPNVLQADQAVRILGTYIEQALQLLTQPAAAWPDARQPLPAIRHEHLNILFASRAEGSLLQAFRVGLKMRFDSNPVLYPERHHPLCTTRAWFMLSVVLHIHDNEDAVPERQRIHALGIDTQTVLIGLLVELEHDVMLSHGADSIFASRIRDLKDLKLSAYSSESNGTEKLEQVIKSFFDEQIPLLEQFARSPAVNHALPAI